MVGSRSVPSASFRKTGSPDMIRVEMAKTTAARDVGSSSGLFYVPRVLEANPDAGYLDSELLSGLTTLTDLTGRDDPNLMRALTLLGTGLAEVHGRLKLEPAFTLPMPSRWAEWGDDGVFVHGDLTMNNVCWDDGGDRLVILDWSSAPALGAPVTVASRYFDLAWFCLAIFWEPPWARRPMYPGGAMCDRFLTSYANASNHFSGERFRQFDHDAILAAAFWRSHPALRSRLAQRLRRARWSRWLRSSRALDSLR